MKLIVKERLAIAGLYPKEGNIITQTLVRDIQKKVTLTQAEIKKYNFRQLQDKFVWDEKGKGKDIEFTEAEVSMLKGEIDKLDKENKITQDILNVCLKIKNYEPKEK